MKLTEPAKIDLVESEARNGAVNYPRLSHLVIVSAPGLLPMWYSLRELAQELEVSVRSIQWWLDQGMSCRRDEHGHVWINGRQFAAWVKASTAQRSRQSLQKVVCRAVRHG